MSTILVTGADGFVGSWTIPALLRADHRVVAMVRTAEAGALVRDRLPAAWRDGVEPRVADVTEPATLGAAFDGADAVLHLAAIPLDRNGGAELFRVNTGGTRNVVAAARTAGVRRLIHMGALGVVDDPALHYASSKAKAEALVRESGLDWTILKPSLQFGEGDGFFNIIADLIRVSPGIVPVPGDGRSRFQPIHGGDVARIVAWCLQDPATIGQTFELGGPRYWTYREITAEVAARAREVAPRHPAARAADLARRGHGRDRPPALPGRHRPAPPAPVRQHRPARRHRSAVRVRAAADGRRPGVPAREAP